MNKVLVIGDLHIGTRNGSPVFLKYMKSYFQDSLFPLIKEKNIKTVIQLGDTLDKRKSIDFVVSAFLIKEWFSWFDENNVQLYSILGNHDTYFKNTNTVAGIKQYENLFQNVKIISEPETLRIGKTSFLMVPWICPENREQIETYLSNPPSDTYNIACGHFELSGFEIQKNIISKSGTIETDSFSSINKVYSGHYHTPSRKGIIEYTGSPYWLSWSDYGDKKNVLTLDANDPVDSVEYHYSSGSLFHKLIYQPGMEPEDITIPTGSFVRLVVNEPDDFLEIFVNKLTEHFNLSQCQVIDVSTDNALELNSNELETLELESPFNVLMNVIKKSNNAKLESELLEIYKEAQNRLEDCQ